MHTGPAPIDAFSTCASCSDLLLPQPFHSRCQRGLLQTETWPCWFPAEMPLGDSTPSPTSLRIHVHSTCVISSHLAVLSLSHFVYVFPCFPSHAVCPLPFPSSVSVPGFYPFLLWGSAQLKPPPAILQIGLGAPSLFVYNNISRLWLLCLQPCTHGALFCLFVLIFFLSSL